MLASTAAIDLGFLAFEPQTRLVRRLVGRAARAHDGRPRRRGSGCRRDPLTVSIAAIFVGKLIWEHLRGPLPFTAESLTVPVIHEAHSYGAIGGALCAMVLLARRGRVRAPL